ncbi:MAG: hypothetical protein WEA77_02295 [Hyphomonas sp.]|uniref:hypothetical protein n=1 Tax=Hyphomonas sp. TaxID=87 RepID=UPI0034A06C53
MAEQILVCRLKVRPNAGGVDARNQLAKRGPAGPENVQQGPEKFRCHCRDVICDHVSGFGMDPGAGIGREKVRGAGRQL